GGGLAHYGDSPPESSLGGSARGDRGSDHRLRGRLPLRDTEPGAHPRSRGVDAVSPALGDRPGVPGAFALGSAAHDGAPAAGRSGSPGTLAHALTRWEATGTVGRSGGGCDGRVVPRAGDPPRAEPVPNRSIAARVQRRRPHSSRGARRIPP